MNHQPPTVAHERSRPAPEEGAEDEEEEDDTPDYTGPVFEDLDDTLQQVWEVWSEMCGDQPLG